MVSRTQSELEISSCPLIIDLLHCNIIKTRSISLNLWQESCRVCQEVMDIGFDSTLRNIMATTSIVMAAIMDLLMSLMTVYSLCDDILRLLKQPRDLRPNRAPTSESGEPSVGKKRTGYMHIERLTEIVRVSLIYTTWISVNFFRIGGLPLQLFKQVQLIYLTWCIGTLMTLAFALPAKRSSTQQEDMA